MKKTKAFIALILCALMIFSLSSCGEKTAYEEQTTESTEISVTDQAGNQLVLSKKAEKIVSCYYISTYALLSLGLADNIVGLEKKPEKRPVYKMAAPELLEKPQVGSLKEFSVEKTMSLSPDLVIMPVKIAKHGETLRDMGINVLTVDPESQSSLEEMLRLIGKCTGTEDRAEKLISYYGEKESFLESIAPAERPEVYMAGNSSFLSCATDKMYQADLIKKAGGLNAAAGIEGDYWAEVSYESIIEMNPQYIILPSGSTAATEEILKDGNLKDVSAVKNGRVYKMPSDIEEWDSPVPSGILGALWLASVINGEKYSPEDFKKDAEAFYTEFYGFTPVL